MTITRRDFSRSVLAGLTAGTLVGTGGCGSSEGSETDAGTGGGDGGNACTLYPQQTAGPYYLDLDLLRRDIREGKPGTELSVVLRVQSAACSALKDLAVDLWHCDAEGVYSGFPGQLGGLDTTGLTFLRGTQVTDGDGIARFDSIYPGWYPGRTTHIHFRIHTSSTTEATSQLYFPENITEGIYAMSPYDVRGPKDTPNALDGIATANPPPLAMITGDASSRYVAEIVVTVG